MKAGISGQKRVTSNSADDEAPAWSPDGAHPAISSERDGGAMYIVHPNGSNPTILLKDPSLVGYAARWGK